MQTKKRAGLVSPSGLLKLAGHTAMGIAMGLGLALLLMVIAPSGIAAFIDRGDSQAITVFVETLVLTFGIGTTLTGAFFILTEDD